MSKVKKLDTNKVALVFGLLLGGGHLVWSLLVFIGLAQILLDFVFWMHMIFIPVKITGFTLTQSLIVVTVTFVVGYTAGWIFAWVWNQMHK